MPERIPPHSAGKPAEPGHRANAVSASASATDGYSAVRPSVARRYDFDAPTDRTGTDSLKFDRHVERGKRPDLLSLWVADMDFPCPDEAVEALVKRARHGIFGYSEPGSAYYQAVCDWMERHHRWRPDPAWFVHTPGVVSALALIVQAFTHPGDAVLVQQPVYYPFGSSIRNNGRHLVNCPLVYDAEAARYHIDFDAFERAVTQHNVKLFLLCNPHNPGGRAWSADELRRLGTICLRHGVIVASDEIHMDFAYSPCVHVPYASLGDEFAQQAIVCTSGGKTFNLAGLQTSNTIVPNPRLRRTLRAQVARSGYSQPNSLGIVATQACYRHGDEWLAQLKRYLAGNLQLVRDHFANHAPAARVMIPDSTYLVWIDLRAWGRYGADLERLVEEDAGLWLDCGDMFGEDGDGFVRINMATQRAYLQQALQQLTDALAAHPPTDRQA
ncbi:pyridoxal phosphate-dependent aminotransferase [Berryella wangjianweii]|uniref:cysteine-S-conjugate beta-lyase n=1 Tax=Berryella wangjianweii TaxID=2734634 RepID=A0A6M8J8T1_9ACTN|nr:MalY/PatB family protein [Berryella wangjianweii]QKF07878.1 pyridoxal phosphate-dependent aminotransferase [Berryella wangjianweii]